MKIPKRFKFVLLFAFWTSFATGLLWWFFDHWVKIYGPLGEEHHPLQVWFTRLHSAFAYILLVALGYLFKIHVEPGLKGKKRKISGITMVTIFSVLILTALPILYASDGWFREASSQVHTYLGFFIPLILGFHVRIAKR